jgi:hypothetical protein
MTAAEAEQQHNSPLSFKQRLWRLNFVQLLCGTPTNCGYPIRYLTLKNQGLS